MNASLFNDTAPSGNGASVNKPNTSHDLTPVVLIAPDGVPDWAWLKLASAGNHRWEISERDASGEVIGTAYRLPDGSKDFKPGGKRGLIVAWPLDNYAGTSPTDPIYVCEGASDTAALLGLYLTAVGIPMAGKGGSMLAELLKDRYVVIVSDADTAGKNSTAKLTEALLPSCASVRTIDPPNGAKDARAAVIAGASEADFANLTEAAAIVKPVVKPTNGSPVLVRLCDVKPEQVSWLWPNRIAIGKLTLIAGDPGLGKSFVTLDMAARLSRGLPWPDSPNVHTIKGGTVILSAEDGIADIIVPRLLAAGADVERISAIEAIHTIGERGRESVRSFDLSRDMPALESAIKSVDDCKLVVIDPVTAYLGSEVNSHNNAEVRGLLAPLSGLAAKHGVAVVAVTHLNKSGGGPAIYRAMGSLAFAAAARAAWSVSKDKADDKRRLFLPIKNNIAPDSGGLAYRIESAEMKSCPIVVWETDPVAQSADDALSIDGREPGDGSAFDDAMEWLRDVLSQGPCAAKDVLAQAKTDGIKERTLERARKALGVKSQREGYANAGRWVWVMPHTPPTNPKTAKPETVADNGDLGGLCKTSEWGEV